MLCWRSSPEEEARPSPPLGAWGQQRRDHTALDHQQCFYQPPGDLVLARPKQYSTFHSWALQTSPVAGLPLIELVGPLVTAKLSWKEKDLK